MDLRRLLITKDVVYLSPLIGWLITALAVAMGAPFWFDLLSRLINVRGSGPKPATAAASHT